MTTPAKLRKLAAQLSHGHFSMGDAIDALLAAAYAIEFQRELVKSLRQRRKRKP